MAADHRHGRLLPMNELSPEAQRSPYFCLINQEGEVRLSNIEKFEPYALGTIDLLMRKQWVYGQRYLFEEDMLLFYLGKPVAREESVERG